MLSYWPVTALTHRKVSISIGFPLFGYNIDPAVANRCCAGGIGMLSGC